MKKNMQGNTPQMEVGDIQFISKKLESLPQDKLMYVAGAITALAETAKRPIKTKGESHLTERSEQRPTANAIP